MANEFSIDFDADDAFAGLDRLLAGIESAVRPAAQAGAQVLYDEVVTRVTGLGSVTGNLRSSIYQAFSKDHSSATHAEYHISWNARKAPHGHLLEYGYVQKRARYIGDDGKWYTSKEPLPAPRMVPAYPFIRPAYDAKRRRAAERASEVYSARMNALISGLGAA